MRSVDCRRLGSEHAALLALPDHLPIWSRRYSCIQLHLAVDRLDRLPPPPPTPHTLILTHFTPGIAWPQLKLGIGSDTEKATAPTSPRYSFRHRFQARVPDYAFTPGPSDYTMPTKTRGAAFSIGSSSHPKPFTQEGLLQSVYISKEHAEENKGVHSPGPTTISNPRRGSRERRAPSFSFGSDDRF